MLKNDGPLRVLMTADCVGGVWTYAVDLARGLSERGSEAILAVLGPEPDAEQQKTAASARGLRLVVTGEALDWTASGPEAVRLAAARVASLAAELSADIIHVNSPALASGPHFPVPIIAACHSCVATWWTSVRTGPMPPDFAWRAQLVAQGYAASDALVAPTSAFADATAATYGLKRRPSVVPNGRSAPSPMRRGEARHSSGIAFTAGRLWDEGKNVAKLDKAAARMRTPLLAAGPTEGPNGARIALAHLRTLGRLDEMAVRKWLASAPVFVSVARYEPFGLAVLEAAQAGCPLVLSDIPTFRELWEGAAEFVSPDDHIQIADVVDRLAGDPIERGRLGHAARERARRYSVEAMAEGVLAVYRTVLNGTRASNGPRVAA